MTIEIRPPSGDELRTARQTVAAALLFPPQDDATWEKSRPSWEEMVSLTAWDGGACVGHVGHFLVDTTVPGGARLSTGAVSRVGVLSTHRRRGLATRLMQGLIERAANDGLALMSLRASEAVIYPRYGFGLAGEFAEAEIDPVRAKPVAGAATGGSFRLVPADEILSTLPAVYDRYAHTRPGVITRPTSFWERYYKDAINQSAASLVVAHVTDGEIDGFAHYDVSWKAMEQEGFDGGRGEIHDVVGATPLVELALWSYLFDVDLVRRWRVEELAIDDVVRYAVADPRAIAIKSVDDEQWVRLIDVDRALSSRTYNPAAGSVVIRVSDPLIAANNGTWRVSSEGAERVDAEPDLTVGIATLSAAYLGGTSWHALHASGSVETVSDQAVVLADILFRSTPLPFCGSFF